MRDTSNGSKNTRSLNYVTGSALFPVTPFSLDLGPSTVDPVLLRAHPSHTIIRFSLSPKSLPRYTNTPYGDRPLCGEGDMLDPISPSSYYPHSAFPATEILLLELSTWIHCLHSLALLPLLHHWVPETQKKGGLGGAAGGLVGRTPCFHWQGPGSIPGWGAEIPQALRPKNKNNSERCQLPLCYLNLFWPCINATSQQHMMTPFSLQRFLL